MGPCGFGGLALMPGRQTWLLSEPWNGINDKKGEQLEVLAHRHLLVTPISYTGASQQRTYLESHACVGTVVSGLGILRRFPRPVTWNPPPAPLRAATFHEILHTLGLGHA